MRAKVTQLLQIAFLDFTLGLAPSCAAIPGTAFRARLLDRRAWLISIRAKHTTVASFGLETNPTSRAVIKELARIHWHRFEFCRPAMGTRNHRVKCHCLPPAWSREHLATSKRQAKSWRATSRERGQRSITMRLLGRLARRAGVECPEARGRGFQISALPNCGEPSQPRDANPGIIGRPIRKEWSA